MASTKDIQRRIKSVNNTKKITKAMEMVAAAKMRRATEAVLKTRTYSNLSWTTILNLSQSVGVDHPLLNKDEKTSINKDEKKKVAIILISSNRGLCGGFNSNIMTKAHDSIKIHDENEKGEYETDFIVIGKKGSVVSKYYDYNVVAEFPKLDIISEIKEVFPISKMVIDDYLAGKYSKIMVAYTDFVNAGKQIPKVRQLLPVDIRTEGDFLGIVGDSENVAVTQDFVKEKEEKYLHDEKFAYEYTFEPSPKEVLDEMVPRLIEIQLFQALLESNASEHSARMAAMHQANEAANDLVGELTLYYNKARQASITNEIAEIAAGAEALAE